MQFNTEHHRRARKYILFCMVFIFFGFYSISSNGMDGEGGDFTDLIDVDGGHASAGSALRARVDEDVDSHALARPLLGGRSKKDYAPEETDDELLARLDTYGFSNALFALLPMEEWKKLRGKPKEDYISLLESIVEWRYKGRINLVPGREDWSHRVFFFAAEQDLKKAKENFIMRKFKRKWKQWKSSKKRLRSHAL